MLTTLLLIDLLALAKEGTAAVSLFQNKICLQPFKRRRKRYLTTPILYIRLSRGPIGECDFCFESDKSKMDCNINQRI